MLQNGQNSIDRPNNIITELKERDFMSIPKPYLIDVPVRVKIWSRPDYQKKQFDVIKQAKPSTLFILSDGGRTDEEWKKIYENRKLYDEGIDWDCTVHKLYLDKNYGLYGITKVPHYSVWEKTDRCIMLEDDVIPDVSFFRYCAELLDLYKDDKRVSVICGRNIGVYDDCTSDYFFSREGSIWGYATWRRTMELFNDFSYGEDEYVLSQLKNLTKKDRDMWRRLKGYASNVLVDGHPAASEFFFELFSYCYNQLQIIPKKNLISNIGVGKNAIHSDEIHLLPRAERNWYNQPVYEMTFPMKHPHYIFPDEKYENMRNNVMAYNRPLIKIKRKAERSYLLMKNGEWDSLLNKIKKYISRKNEIEK